MHYCIYLFTKDLPTDEQINTIMAPYSDENHDKYSPKQPMQPDIQWDYWVVGGRYSGLLKLGCRDDDDVYKWRFYIEEPRAGRLFRCQFLEELIEARRNNHGILSYGFYSPSSIEKDFLSYSGIRDGYIRVDGCKISDLANLEERLDGGYGFIDDEFQKVSTRDWWNTDIRNFEENSEYEKELKDAFERNKDNYLTIIDIHD